MDNRCPCRRSDCAEVQALHDERDELADDVRALSTLIHVLRTALVSAGIVKGGSGP